jgi:hypothetical protein
MAFILDILSGKNILRNEIARLTVQLPLDRADPPHGSEEGRQLLHFAIGVDAFVKGITLESKNRACASVGKAFNASWDR